MKRVLKFLGYTLGVIVLCVAAAALYFQIKGIPTFEPGLPADLADLHVSRDSAQVAEGARIAAMLCKKCHTDPSTGKLTGTIMGDLPPMFGQVVTYNITQDSVHGIGAWTDGELYYLLRTGKHRDGSWSPPFMPKFERLADEDVHAIIAWLRSDDPALAPDPKEYPPNDYNLFCTILANTLFSPPPMPEKAILPPDPQDPIALGRYLANDMLGCYHCHSGDLLKVDAVPEKSFLFYGGGAEMKNEAGEVVRTANLTPDPETGIGRMTEQQFIDAVRFGKNPRGGTLTYPMLPYPSLSDAEARAIFTYLKTVPPIHHPVDRYKAAGLNQ